ncbi:MAG: hypothetical protein UV58_C0015G0010 [Candidatus Wolfebacteria bacterium GW2011_GWC1_43_10]|uniref:Thioredoxin domain-containing protein n=1 Tax=Candidatus Wolfebacteria bacterium GW2011_GWC1_43_10 TaxID=1619011 RepID=A0A0G1EFR5_9BACT|nr:MAG: hypothetical protein UV58_C0015G0010 [Candidatus Wolfebacteria bacterium GW2011_GWC1_43_10]KKT23038.1 MAG: hypothetical protein UW08_C0001G0001 [Parcubacteria group bacterium GW2011_GWB1_43_8b]
MGEKFFVDTHLCFCYPLLMFSLRKIFLLILFLFGVFFVFNSSLAQEKPNITTLYFFWGDGCPHCADEEVFLKTLETKYSNLEIKDFEVWYNTDNQKLLTEAEKKLNTTVSGIPFTVVGNWSVVGYTSDQTTGKEIEKKVKECLATSCPDPLASLFEDEQRPDAEEKINPAIPESITFPLIGEVKTKNLSLPLLTAVFGLVDGFNPCAMWVLIFLIGLLLEMQNRTRMWILGTAFIIVSGLVYFIFMAAWLNLLLFIGFIVWVRPVIGLVAVGGGVWSLKEYFTKPVAVCAVEDSEKKRTVFEKLKETVKKENFWLALAGIILLGASVNLIELMCSAGLPAVYTQILSLSQLSVLSYYFYLVLYIVFYMLDDIIVFIIAMTTLQLTGLSGKYARWSRLIGGAILLILGILLIFKPGWLMF